MTEEAGRPAAASGEPPPPKAVPAPAGEPPAEQWPDTLPFWLVTTLVAIAVPAILCAGGYAILRKLW